MNGSYSTSPARIKPKKSMVKPLCPQIGSMHPKYIWQRFVFNLGYSTPMWKAFCQIMNNGDSNPAVVCNLQPLLVAAYSFDCDCAVLIRYPDDFAQKFKLQKGSRLLSVNTYSEDSEPDVVQGSRSSRNWGAFQPRIANFLTEDVKSVQRRMNDFSLDIWDYVYQCGVEYAKRFPHQARSANPMFLEYVKY